MVGALGFSLCHKLGRDNPDMAIRNCNSVALYALGKPDFHLRNHQRKGEKCLPPEYRCLPRKE